VSGATIARRPLDGPVAGAPLLHEESVLVTLRAGRLMRLALGDLHPEWTRDLPPPLVTPAVWGDEEIAQAAPRGEVATFDPEGRSITAFHLREAIICAPIFSRGRVVVSGVRGTMAVFGGTP
jgi:hypothetical protein